MRAEGKSYADIAAALNMSKSTCHEWEETFKDEIATYKAKELELLYDAYYMTKAARIKKLGSTLERIDAALDKADLTEIAPEKLLDFKLKYTMALKEEYIPTAKTLPADVTPDYILEALTDIYNQMQTGTIDGDQAYKRVSILAATIRAYDQTKLKDQLDLLESLR